MFWKRRGDTGYWGWLTEDDFVDIPAPFDDAPADGELYGRKDNAWEIVPNDLPTGGTTGQVLKKDSNADYDVSWQDDEDGWSDAPSDGSTYGRKDGDWEVITGGGIPEAPIDGEYYARKDADWEIIPADSGITQAHARRLIRR